MSILEDMHIFVEVANARSFTRAAAALDMPVSTLSKRVRRLEESVGVRLFSRSTRVVELTELGVSYLENCKRIVAEALSAHEELSSNAASPTGVLRVALPIDFSTAFLDLPIARFASRYPKIHLHLDLTSRPVDLVAESLDVVVRIGRPADSGLIAHHLADLTRYFYANPQVASKLSELSSPEELDPIDCIGLSGQTAERWETSNGIRSTTITPTGSISTNNVGLLRRLVSRGMAVSAFAEAMVRPELDSGALVQIFPEWHVQAEPVYAFTQSRLVPAKVRLFVATLADALREEVC